MLNECLSENTYADPNGIAYRGWDLFRRYTRQYKLRTIATANNRVALMDLLVDGSPSRLTQRISNSEAKIRAIKLISIYSNA